DAKYKVFSAKVIWDNEIIGGDFVNTAEFAARQIQRNDPYLNLDYELVHKNKFFYGQNFYRAYVKLDPSASGGFNATVGRQKVDWGSMRLFSPADLFTPLSIFQIEKEEKVGVTAANLVLPIGSSLRLNPVYAFDPTFDRSRIGGRLTKTLGRFDMSALGGKFLRDRMVGFDFTGDVKTMGVRAEATYDWADIGKNFLQIASGIDYGFENSLYVAFEYFFNGQGTNNTATFLPLGPSGAQIRTAHQNFLGLIMKYDVTPLWTVSLQDITDLNGGSTFLNPETKYALLSWLEITGGVQLPMGKVGGEFATISNFYYLQTQLFF
ncbi:MAG: hypothetical protein HY073_04675, partial [Deltaproteobacteria bacterium]|nr:hypothetical protein [Deltaproteobacteria bacterium]